MNLEKNFLRQETVAADSLEDFKKSLDKFDASVKSIDTTNELWIAWRNRENFQIDKMKVKDIQGYVLGKDMEENSLSLEILPGIAKSLGVSNKEIEQMTVEQLHQTLADKAS